VRLRWSVTNRRGGRPPPAGPRDGGRGNKAVWPSSQVQREGRHGARGGVTGRRHHRRIAGSQPRLRLTTGPPSTSSPQSFKKKPPFLGLEVSAGVGTPPPAQYSPRSPPANQPPSKNCTHAYLSPYPFLRGEHNSTSYDSAVIYRGFWAVLMLLGVVAVVTASFLIICAAPFASHFLYKAGGGSYIAAGILFSLVVMLYVIWVQAVADMESYKNMKMKDCVDFTPSVLYGWSFFLAPAGIFFSLLAGLLFLVVGRHIQIHH
uniref:Transmembrane protein 182 n=1 Tax=Equus caballus TaxID=9796 RepID=A0A9L0SC15_HORSE